MREIKFRAWDNYTNEMVANDNLAIVGGNPAYTIQGDVPLVIDSLIVMQYTGLKDKNGKEIYEGDIVRLRKHAEGAGVGEVIFSSKAAKFAVRVKRAGYSGPKEPHLISILKSEILGNIYQNPELLEAV